MFRILKNVIFLSLLLVLNLEAKEKELTNKQMLEFESLELFKKAGIKVEKAYDIGSLYLLSIVVQGNKDEIFLTKDKNYLISGAVIIEEIAASSIDTVPERLFQPKILQTIIAKIKKKKQKNFKEKNV